MNQYIDQIFYYKHAVCSGICTPQEAALWAEHFFDSSSTIEEWMISLVGAQNVNDVTDALDPLLLDLTPDEVWKRLKNLLKTGVEDKKINALTALFYAEDYATEGDDGDIITLLYDYEGFQKGYSNEESIEEIDAEVLLFLKREPE
ncbi:MAG: hypothetical protein CMK59_06695 [Proteobacteria bacterium]|nr:hypothetical protein [Pseudomonadota bacterium]